uniref:Pheromone-binding protein-related protein 5 n=2 Tax=Lygus hesperus TaxID=30085 RepID=A0A0A9Y2M8_LYGHE
MKSRFGIVFASLTILHSVNAGTIRREYLAKVVEAKDKCLKEFNVDDSVVEDFLKKNIKPESKSGQCMVACFLEERGMMADGKILSEGVKLNNEEQYKDPADVEKGNKVTDMCDTEVPNEGKDKCLLAADYAMCVVKRSEEAGLPKIDFAHPTD